MAEDIDMDVLPEWAQEAWAAYKATAEPRYMEGVRIFAPALAVTVGALQDIERRAQLAYTQATDDVTSSNAVEIEAVAAGALKRVEEVGDG